MILYIKNEEYISVTYGCIRFTVSYRFQLSSLDSLVKTVVDKSIKSLKDLGEGIVGNDYKLNIVTDIGEYNRAVKDLKKYYPDKINELEEALPNYMGENDLKIFENRIS